MFAARPVALVAAATTLATLATLSVTSPSSAAPTPAAAKHVLLISVDGLHQSDLAAYVAAHPRSALAAMLSRGTSYTNVRTPFPSDSFPGMLAQVTGGNPKTTGVYYDYSYNHDLLPAGTTHCQGVARGTVVAFDESLDKNPDSIDAGQGLAKLPSSILAMTSSPQTLIDRRKLPVDPASCAPVFPHSYLKVNTVFEVARAHGMRTAWSDKHAAYDILNGPSGAGVQDLFTPEINSIDPALSNGDDWTKDNEATQQYDSYKVASVLNEIDGLDHSGKRKVGVPALFGMNFQSVSTAQKLPMSGGRVGGYSSDGKSFGPVMTAAMAYVDAQVGRLLAEISRRKLDASTTVILSAKHGQSPKDGAALTRIDDGAIIDAMNAAWRAASHSGDLVVGSISDDAMLLWLSDRSREGEAFAASFLTAYDGDGTGADGHAKATGIDKPAKAYRSAGLSGVLTGSAARQFIGITRVDGRTPDVIGIASHGTVFTGGTKKIAEHGGLDPADRWVPLVVAGAGVGHARVATAVETTEIAPTILALLGLDPNALQAVRIEGTAVLPALAIFH